MDLAALQPQIERFLYHEARLLDSNRFHEWLDLFAEDARYLMPSLELIQGQDRVFDTDDFHFGYYDEDRDGLAFRIRQLDTGLRHSEVPPSLTERFITNVLVEESGTADEVEVYSNFLVHQVRHGTHEATFSGRREDRLRRTDDGWRVVRRTVIMLKPLLPRTISIFF
jgi:3-phenylpropionate/cinnamic acid dioxygenase small subunit